MILSRQRHFTISLLVSLLFFLVACGSGAPQTKTAVATPTPAPDQGQQILNKLSHDFKNAHTVHSIFNLHIEGQAINGDVTDEVWNAQTQKSRTVVLKSSIQQVPQGQITVNDGKQIWQYDPGKKVVYKGSVNANAGQGGGQFSFNFIQNIFTRSNGTLRGSASINGHDTYDIHIIPQDKPATPAANTDTQNNLDYEGELYVDKNSQLPQRIDLNAQNNQIKIDFTKLELNPTLPGQTFVFQIPAGVQVLPLPTGNAGNGSGSMTLAQAEQQAGYHLLHIPSNQKAYILTGISALGAPGNQIYTLSYMKGATAFTISEGKPLANLPASGQALHLRNTTATFSNEGGSNTLAWTENGVGIHITGSASQDQLVAIATILS